MSKTSTQQAIFPEAEYTVFNAGKQQAEMGRNCTGRALADSGKELFISTVGEITTAKQAFTIITQGAESNSLI